MTRKHIISFLPSATQTLHKLNSWDKIVGISHTCEIPKNQIKKPRIIKLVMKISRYSSKQIDEKIRELVNSGNDMYTINKKLIQKSNTDLVIAQGICEVCSPIEREAKKTIEILNYEPEILILNPQNLKDIFSDVKKIGTKIDKEKQADMLIKSCKIRIKHISKLLNNHNLDMKPDVLCIEWIDPFYTAGHWIPDMIEIAGGKNLLSQNGEKSRRFLFSEITEIDPDVIIFMPCGFNLNKTEHELNKFFKNHQLKSLKAYKNKKKYLQLMQNHIFLYLD